LWIAWIAIFSSRIPGMIPADSKRLFRLFRLFSIRGWFEIV